MKNVSTVSISYSNMAIPPLPVEYFRLTVYISGVESDTGWAEIGVNQWWEKLEKLAENEICEAITLH